MTLPLMIFCSAVAALPAAMVAGNIRHYRRLPEPSTRAVPSISVLIPARNEAANIRAAIESVLQNEGVDFEVLVWDDGSTDGTGDIVREISLKDARVSLVLGTQLPADWAGKPFGCWNLAQRARGDVLLFIDADVRLRGDDALLKMAAGFLRPDLDLLSGVPWQKVEALSEVMFVPLIHFVLLGFLPIERMRASTDPRFAAACGQLMLARRSTYMELGGHGLVRRSFHEGLALARGFRKAGKITDLFDATDVAACRMYSGLGEVWRGFAKNAHEGLASPSNVVPFSFLLFFGQVLPLLCLLILPLSKSEARWALAAVALGYLARGILAIRFEQPYAGVFLQPVAVGMLLLNQWYGGLRYWMGRPVAWRGRALAVAAAAVLPHSFMLAADVQKCPSFVLDDQSAVTHQVEFPRRRPLYIVAASRSGTAEIAGWVKPIEERFGEAVEILGLADVRGVPSVFHGLIRRMIKEGTQWPVLLDWNGDLVPALCSGSSSTQVLVIHPNGDVVCRQQGKVSKANLDRVCDELHRLTQQKALGKQRG
jgi:hypothetical protein